MIICLSALPGCSFLPGFDSTEQPLLYHLPVSEVAKQVSCELQDVLADFRVYQSRYSAKVDPANPNQLAPPRWYLSSDDVEVKLTLMTNSSGYVGFSGINAANLGLANLAPLFTSATVAGNSVPTLGAKITPKRTAKAVLGFSVSPVPPVPASGEALTLKATTSLQTRQGRQYTQENKAAGGKGDYTFSIVGELPSGVILSNKKKGTISGIPDKSGPFAYVVRVTDSANQSVDQLVTGTIAPAGRSLEAETNASLKVISNASEKLQKDVIYEQANTATGGDGHYRFTIVSGAPPAGTSLEAVGDAALIRGTPTKTGSFVYIVEVRDNAGAGSSAYQVISGTIRNEGEAPYTWAPTPTHCPEWALHPDRKLFLKNWLTNYFDKINSVTEVSEMNYKRVEESDRPDMKDHTTLVERQFKQPLCDLGNPGDEFKILRTPCLPDGTKFTSVVLTTAFTIAADVNSGLSPFGLFGPDRVFLIPINGLSADLNADYTNQLEITLQVCDNTKGGCKSAIENGSMDQWSDVFESQCHIYGLLSPLLKDVKPPKNVLANNGNKDVVLTCSKFLACYIVDSTKNSKESASDTPVCFYGLKKKPAPNRATG
jgi:hypothetical protein